MTHPHEIAGIKIFENPYIPARRPIIELRAGICSPAFERETNAWLLELFGTTPVFWITDNGSRCYTHPANMPMLRMLAGKP